MQLEYFLEYVNIAHCVHHMFHDEVPVAIISLDCSHQLGGGIILVEEKFLLEKPFLKYVHLTD